MASQEVSCAICEARSAELLFWPAHSPGPLVRCRTGGLVYVSPTENGCAAITCVIVPVNLGGIVAIDGQKGHGQRPPTEHLPPRAPRTPARDDPPQPGHIPGAGDGHRRPCASST